ncbi:MAG: hypothetical protein KC502_10725 [Myxococcales bacterium]|nr:hypothetical protein [Myxococcales bacterium]
MAKIPIPIRSWSTSLCILTALVSVGCSTGHVVRTTEAPKDAEGLSRKATAGRPGRAPVRRPDLAQPPTRKSASAGQVPALSPETLKRLANYRLALRNAARRDREMERTMRTYMVITHEVFRRLRSSGASGPGAVAYDPTPTWRFQAQVRRDFVSLAARAGVIERHLGDLAQKTNPKADRRGERIALYRSIFTCIRGDTWHRSKHGKAWLDRPSSQPVSEPA